MLTPLLFNIRGLYCSIINALNQRQARIYFKTNLAHCQRTKRDRFSAKMLGITLPCQTSLHGDNFCQFLVKECFQTPKLGITFLKCPFSLLLLFNLHLLNRLNFAYTKARCRYLSQLEMRFTYGRYIYFWLVVI